MWQHHPPLPSELRRRLEHLSLHADPLSVARQESVAAVASRSGPQGTSVWCRIWHFPTPESAERWNAQWDGVLARPDEPHPALTHIAGQAIADPFLDALARIASVILSQEIQAGSPCPYVEDGWSYALRLEQRLHPSALGLGERPCVLRLVGEVRGPDGQTRWCADASRVYTSETLPAPVAAVWSVRHWSEIEENYA